MSWPNVSWPHFSSAPLLPTLHLITGSPLIAWFFKNMNSSDNNVYPLYSTVFRVYFYKFLLYIIFFKEKVSTKKLCVLQNFSHIIERVSSEDSFYSVWNKKVSPLAQHFLCLTLTKTIFRYLPFHSWTQFGEQIANRYLNVLPISVVVNTIDRVCVAYLARISKMV